MTLSFVSRFGVSSKNPMTTWTMFVMACLSWPCFLDSSRTCSLSKLQSLASLQRVTIETKHRDVVARSDACNLISQTQEGSGAALITYLSGLFLEGEDSVNTPLDIFLQNNQFGIAIDIACY